jgi:hypothetical protein
LHGRDAGSKVVDRSESRDPSRRNAGGFECLSARYTVAMWLLLLIALVAVLVAVVAIPVGYRGRSAGSQNTTIIEREQPPAERESTVVERRYERRTGD